MKKMIALLLALAALLGCTACGQKEEATTVEPDVAEMRAICELSTMDCYYHNVAKYFEKDAQKGFLGIGKKDKRFWIEYSGVVQISGQRRYTLSRNAYPFFQCPESPFARPFQNISPHYGSSSP